MSPEAGWHVYWRTLGRLREAGVRGAWCKPSTDRAGRLEVSVTLEWPSRCAMFQAGPWLEPGRVALEVDSIAQCVALEASRERFYRR